MPSSSQLVFAGAAWRRPSPRPGGQVKWPASTTYDPARLALWTEFHEKVATLSEQERTVFEMHYYLELTQAEIAQVLELHPRKVSYLWIAATENLGEELDGAL